MAWSLENHELRGPSPNLRDFLGIFLTRLKKPTKILNHTETPNQDWNKTCQVSSRRASKLSATFGVNLFVLLLCMFEQVATNWSRRWQRWNRCCLSQSEIILLLAAPLDVLYSYYFNMNAASCLPRTLRGAAFLCCNNFPLNVYSALFCIYVYNHSQSINNKRDTQMHICTKWDEGAVSRCKWDAISAAVLIIIRGL
jgi:hypothetical protein